MIRFNALVFLTLLSCSPVEKEKLPESENPITTKEETYSRVLNTWHPWENSNNLSFVKMPEGIGMRIVMRSRTQGQSYWMKENYTGTYNSAPRIYNYDAEVNNKAFSYDGSFYEMELNWGEHIIANIKAANTQDGEMVVLYTPIKHTDNPAFICLQPGLYANSEGTIQKESGTISISIKDKLFSFGSTIEPLDLQLNLYSPFYGFLSDQEIGFFSGKKKSIAEIKQIINNGKRKYDKIAEQYSEHSEAYKAMKAVTAGNLIYDHFNKRPLISVSRSWNENWGGYVLFDWDTYFAALMAGFDDKYVAYSTVFNITEEITDNGFIPNVAAPFNIKSNDRSQPPVGSMISWMLYDRYNDKWFLEEVYQSLLSWNRWWAKERDNNGFLSWGSSSHPHGLDSNTLQAAKFESGLDNSPLFDDVVYNSEKEMLELASVGLMGLYIADCNYLADIAKALGKLEDARELKNRSIKYGIKLNELWDEESGAYRDFDIAKGQFSQRLAPTNFYALLSNVPTQKQADRMVNQYLLNEKEFYGEWMMPSISKNDPAFLDNDYWRGRIWAPMNFLVYMGLQNYDLPEASKILAEKSEKLILKEWTENNLVYENYNSVTGQGGDEMNCHPFYSWGGLLGFIGLYEAGYWK